MITIELVGRLGNQMFQYAVCRTIAEKNNYKFFISKENSGHNQNISNYFDLDMGEYDGSNILYTYREDTLKQQFDANIFNIPDNTIINGYFQTDKYFYNNKDIIKTWFKIEKNNKVNLILNQYPIDDYCYIHFRGTDYKEWDGGKRFLPIKYFNDAIKLIKNYKNNIKFLIITDDIVSAKEYFSEYDVISNNMLDDFKLLYYSKYCIIPNSSFSWWASWLSDNKIITIAPNNWLNYQMPEQGFYPYDIKVDKFTYI